MAISLSQSRGIQFNDLYQQRPVWAVVSHPAAANSPMVALYGERSPFVPLAVEAPGVARGRAGRSFNDEATNSGQYFIGTGSLGAASSGYSVQTGNVGISNFSQTGCLANFEISDNGVFGWYSATLSEADKLATRAGVIVGESNWRQCFDLILAEDLKLFKDEIGGGYTYTRGAGRYHIDFATILANAGTSAGGNAGLWGLGQVSHNRNSKRLLVVQPRGGATGVSLTFRLHFFDLQNAIGRDTKIGEIHAWVTACIADPARYRYTDVTVATTRAYYTTDSAFDAAASRFVLCDNDEVWMFKSSDSATSGQSGSNALFRINLSGGNWKTGAYAATQAVGFVNTTQYGAASGAHLAPRHINSDDNSVVALFQHNYYYNIGMNLAMVSTKDAGANSFNYATHTANTWSFAIAPTGGGEFVVTQTNANQDTRGPYLAFLPNERFTGGEQTLIWQSNIWPSVSSSTMYGANIVVKVQPTTEWK